MSQILTDQDFANAKRDISDIDKAVNTESIVDPRWGGDFKSLPLISAEFDAKTQYAQSTINSWQEAINTIIVDDGVPALAVSTASGNNQQEINDFGGAKWRNKAGGYALGATVKLDNGDIVKSTVDVNANDPNVDMDGWVKTNSTSQIVDVSGLNQFELNTLNLNVKMLKAIGDGTLHTLAEIFPSLALAKVFFPFADSLTNSLDWAAIQKAIYDLPYSPVSTISPKESPNGGIVRIPHGKYIFNKKLILKRGVVLQGESEESTQFWSLNTNGLIDYDDEGRYLPDKLGVIGISLWQDPNVIPLSGAGIRIRSSGKVPEAAVTPVLHDLIIEGFYNNLDIGDCINLNIRNINQSKAIADGAIFDSVSFSTSSKLDTCYAHSNGGAGWVFRKFYYVTLTAQASDSNAGSGYLLEDCRGVEISGGAEANTLKAVELKNCYGTRIKVSPLNNKDGAILLDSSYNTVIACSSMTDQAAGSTKVAIVGINGSNFVTIDQDVVMEGSYSTNRITGINKFLDSAISTSMGGDGKHWQFGVSTTLNKISQFFLGGQTSEFSANGLDIQPNFTKSVSSVNKSVNVIFRAFSADTFANAIGQYIGNGIISGGGTIARKIGQVIEKQTNGTSANAALYLTKGSALPLGNWSMVNDQDLPSYFADKIKFGATAATAPYIFSGTGVPTDLTAPTGSIYTRVDGTAGATLYVKEPSGWVAK